METDGSIVDGLESGFSRNRKLISDTMGRMDSVLTSAANNIMCYLIVFVVMILALLYKLTKWSQ